MAARRRLKHDAVPTIFDYLCSENERKRKQQSMRAAFAKRRSLEVRRSGLFTSQLASSHISQNIRLYFSDEILENANFLKKNRQQERYAALWSTDVRLWIISAHNVRKEYTDKMV